MTDLVCLIEQIRVDPLENSIDEAVKYEIIGFIPSEREALKFCSKGKIYTKKDCWAIEKELPEYRYRSIKQIK
ncbi:MAG: hypothetical protein AABX93_03635 [Nanoarchaeota archaeon]